MTESTSKNVRTRHTEFLNRTQFYIKLCFYDKKSKKKILTVVHVIMLSLNSDMEGTAVMFLLLQEPDF